MLQKFPYARISYDEEEQPSHTHINSGGAGCGAENLGEIWYGPPHAKRGGVDAVADCVRLEYGREKMSLLTGRPGKKGDTDSNVSLLTMIHRTRRQGNREQSHRHGYYRVVIEVRYCKMYIRRREKQDSYAMVTSHAGLTHFIVERTWNQSARLLPQPRPRSYTTLQDSQVASRAVEYAWRPNGYPGVFEDMVKATASKEVCSLLSYDLLVPSLAI